MAIKWLQLCIKCQKLSVWVLLISLYLHVRNVSLENDYFYDVRNKEVDTILTVTEETSVSSMRNLQPKSRYKRDYHSHHARKKSFKTLKDFLNENHKTKGDKNKSNRPLRKVNNKLRNTAKPQKFQGFKNPNIMADYNNIVNNDVFNMTASQNFKKPFPSDKKNNNRNLHSVIKTSHRRNINGPSAKRRKVNSTKVQFKRKSYRQLLQKPTNEENLHSECITIGQDLTGENRRKGKTCVFPFIYNGKSHTECTWDQAAPESPWCSTKVDDKGVHVDGLNEWGVCGEGCPIERQIYYCGFWHCEVDKNGTMGEYEDIKSDCKSCEAKCSKDPDCDVVECDYFDSRQCTWRKQVGKQDQGCGKGERMVYSEQYKTCVKPEQARKKSKESMSLDERNNSDAMMESKDSSSKFPRAKGQSQFNSENSANTKTQSNTDEDNSKRKHLNTSENKESRRKDESKSLGGSSKSSSNKINTLRNRDEVSQRFQENEEEEFSRAGEDEDQNILKDRENISPETNRLTIDNTLRNNNNEFKAADELTMENSMSKNDIEVNSHEVSNNRKKKQEENYSTIREGASEKQAEATTPVTSSLSKNVDDNIRRQNEDEQRSESAFSNGLQNDGEEKNFLGKRPSQDIVQDNARVPSSKTSKNLGYEKSSDANSEVDQVNVDDNIRRNQNEDEQRSESAFSNGLQNDGEETNSIGKRPPQDIVQENARMPSSKRSQNLGYDKSSNANSEIDQVNVDDNIRRNQNEDEQHSELASSNGLQNDGEERNFLSKRPPQDNVQENARISTSKMSQNLGYDNNTNADSENDQINVDDNIRRNQNEDEQRSESAFSNGLQNEGKERNFMGKRPPQDIVQENSRGPSSKLSQTLGEFLNSQQQGQEEIYSKRNNVPSRNTVQETTMLPSEVNNIHGFNEGKNVAQKTEPLDDFRIRNGISNEVIQLTSSELSNGISHNEQAKYSRGSKGSIKDIVRQTTREPSSKMIKNPRKDMRRNENTKPKYVDENSKRNRISDNEMMRNPRTSPKSPEKEENNSRRSKELTQNVNHETAKLPSSTMRKKQVDDNGAYEDTDLETYDIQLNPREFPNDEQEEEEDNLSGRYKGTTREIVRRTTKVPSRMNRNQIYGKVSDGDVELEPTDEKEIKDRFSNDGILLTPRTSSNGMQEQENEKFARRNKQPIRNVVQETTITPSKKGKNSDHSGTRDRESKPASEIRRKNSSPDDDMLQTRAQVLNNDQGKQENYPRRGKGSTKNIVQKPIKVAVGRNKNRIGNNQNNDDEKPKTENESIMNKNRIPNDAISIDSGETSNDRENMDEETFSRDNQQLGDRGQKTSKMNPKIDNDGYGNKSSEINKQPLYDNRENNGEAKSKSPLDFERNNPLSNDNMARNNFEISNGQQKKETKQLPTIDEGSKLNIAKAAERVPSEPSKISNKFDDNEGSNANTEQTTDDDDAVQKRIDFPCDQQKKQEVRDSRDSIGSTENLVQNATNDTISHDDTETENADDSKITDSDTNLDISLKNDKPPKLSQPTVRIRATNPDGKPALHHIKGPKVHRHSHPRSVTIDTKQKGPNGVKNDESLETAAASKDKDGHTSTYDGKRKVVNVNDIDIDVDGLLDGLLDGYDGLLKRDQDEDIKVTAILTRLGLDEFIKKFKDNHIDYDAFRRLTFDDMNALKLPIDAREKIRSELSRIKSDEIKGKDSHKKTSGKHDPIDVNIELHLNMNRKTDSNIKEMVSLVVDCMMECCKNHQVPAGCLDKNNEMNDRNNDMHEIIKIVQRDSCSKYQTIYDECTKSCKKLQNMSRFKVKRIKN